MSRIGILTFLHNGNYGSSLQAYALQRVLREMGYECEHIDYLPDNTEKIINMLRCGNNPKLLLEGYRKRSIRKEQTGLQEKDRQILGFYEREMKLSRRCSNHRDLKSISREYDILICGSDQIWNPVWMNPAYFLDFAEEDKKRIAYAASLGINRVPGRKKQRMIRRRLRLFDAVSVREEEGARILVSVTGNRPPVMPDPVCLLSREEWLPLAGNTETWLKTAGNTEKFPPYLLCYFIGNNPKYWERVNGIRRQTGLKVYVIPVSADSYEQQDCFLLDGAGPEEFLCAVRHASILCTDSFHGLAFGTIFGVKVELIPRDREGARDSKNSRTENFIREIHDKGLPAMREEGLSWLRMQMDRMIGTD